MKTATPPARFEWPAQRPRHMSPHATRRAPCSLITRFSWSTVENRRRRCAPRCISLAGILRAASAATSSSHSALPRAFRCWRTEEGRQRVSKFQNSSVPPAPIRPAKAEHFRKAHTQETGFLTLKMGPPWQACKTRRAKRKKGAWNPHMRAPNAFIGLPLVVIVRWLTPYAGFIPFGMSFTRTTSHARPTFSISQMHQ
jgi:hypothetical protein